MSIAEQRKRWREEEEEVSERYGVAFERMRDAQLAVTRQFYPLGNGSPTPESLAAADKARGEFDAIKREFDRIADEIRTGKRS